MLPLCLQVRCTRWQNPPSPVPMFARKRSNRLKLIARMALAAILLAGLLGGMLPLETLASGQMCTLACCAGRAPHAAGSCMDGSCHAALKKHSGQIHSSQRKEFGDQLCGAARFARRLSSGKSIKPAEHSSKENESQQARLSSATITKPCLSDCGSCASGFTNPNRERNTVAVIASTRPPSDLRLIAIRCNLTRQLRALCRHFGPRAPPLSVS